MMKSIMLSILALVLASGCMTTRRRLIPNQGAPALSQATAGGYAPTYGASSRQGSPYGASQVAPYYGGGYGQIQPYFVSEYAGSTYDPRTAGTVIQAEMMREQARRASFVGAPSTPTPTTGITREDLGAVMDEVDTLRQEVDRR